MKLKLSVLILIGYCIVCISCKETKKEKENWIVDSEEGKLRLELVADSITIPYAMVFLPDGRMLVSDRPEGKMIILDVKDGSKTVVHGVTPDVSVFGDGLMDIVLHPEFEKNHELFYVYSIKDDKGFSLTVERARLENDSLVDRKRLFIAQPYYNRSSFYGSRMVLKDGYLYFSTGVDKSRQDSAQLLTNHLAKIMRIKEDGSVPDDNPFVRVKGALPEIWSIGVRNPLGLTINPFTQEIWEHEHGPKGGDEINIINKGKNYGWPLVTYGKEYDDTPVGAGLTEMEGMEPPIHYYVPSIAPSGMVFYTGDVYPKWKGNLFIGALALTHLNRSVIKDNKVVHEERIMKDMKWRVRNVIQGPDGYLYIGVDGGMILKIYPIEE